MALPKQNRLRSSRDFGRVHRKGKRASTDALSMRVLKQTTLDRALADASQKSSRQKSLRQQAAKRQQTASTLQKPVSASQKLVLKANRLNVDKSATDGRVAETAKADGLLIDDQGAGEKLSAPSSCFGISISKKVSKRAVVRNRIKRQLRAIIRDRLPDIRPGWQIVIVVRASAVECDFADFLRELDYLLKKLNVVS